MSIYLDNAATSFPKPEEVYRAVEHALREVGVGPSRGGHRRGVAATRLVFEAREAVAELFSLPDSSRIVFTHSATEGLNLALLGTVRPGDHVVTTTMEHNSVVRPLHKLMESGARVTKVAGDIQGRIQPSDIISALRPETKLVVMSHCSNVTGTLQPVEEIGLLLKKRGILFAVDAAQSAGVVDIRPMECGIDVLAAPGHKGLFGPQGTGIIYIAEGAEPAPLLTGGTGGYSDHAEQPMSMPERYESGTLNTPGIAGLKAGIDFIAQIGLERIRNHEVSLAAQLFRGLEQIKGIRVHGPQAGESRLGVVAFTVDGRDASDIGFRLDHDHDISVRVGLHCAPEAHKTVGTYPGGAIRVSPGWFNTEKEIAVFLDAIKAILKA